MATYRSDSDLEFLAKCSNEDLELLVSILTVDPKDGNERHTQTLTGTTEYLFNRENPQVYWHLIAAELQTFGAHSGMTLLRGGKGVLYREILIDVCKKVKANIDKNLAIETIEQALLMSVLKKSLEKMSKDELQNLATELGCVSAKITPSILMMSIQSSIMTNPTMWNFMTLTILQQLGFNVGKLVLSAGTTFVPRTLPIFGLLTGPIGWTISGLWLVSDIAGPAYRVTVPACFYVAALRQKYMVANIK